MNPALLFATIFVLLCSLRAGSHAGEATNPPPPAVPAPFRARTIEYPPEDLEVYARALHVKDPAMRHAAIGPLTHYAEGIGTLVDFIVRNAADPLASAALEAIVSAEVSEKDEQKLHGLLEQIESKNVRPGDADDLLTYGLLRFFFKGDPETYAARFAPVVVAHVSRADRGRVSGTCLSDLMELQSYVPKETLYGAVPALIDMLDGRIHRPGPWGSPDALSLLTVITGKHFAPSGGSMALAVHPGVRKEMAEKYRAYYYQQLAPPLASDTNQASEVTLPTNAAAPAASDPDASSRSALRASYRERLQRRREAARVGRTLPTPPPIPPEELEKKVQEYQMELIRAKGELGPPLPIPLTPEMDKQLIEEGILPPLE